MKVYGFTTMPQSGWQTTARQVRVIVAAPSKAAAVRTLNAAGMHVSMHYLNTYAATTGNDAELEVATEPGVWWSDERGRPTAANYHRVTP